MQLSKSLSALALLGAVIPSTYALSIKDDTVKLGVGIRLQTRVTSASAERANGDDWSVQEGLAGQDDPLYFTVPRARLSFKGTYGENWNFNLTLMVDNIENTGAGSGRGAAVRYANVERVFKGDSINHSIRFGLDKPYFNESDVGSSSVRLFTTPRNTEAFLKPRGVGIGYKLQGSMFLIAADLQNNLDATNANFGGNNGEADGFFYSARMEFAPSAEWFIAKRAESMLGKEGKGLVFGLGYGVDSDNQDTAGSTLNTSSLHADILFHLNAITAMFTVSTAKAETEVIATGVTTDVKRLAWNIQGGYAFPQDDGTVIEPALRFSMRDSNTDNDTEGSDYGSANSDVANSGQTIEVGLNYYLSGHSNKFQLGLMLWTGEEDATGEEASATIIRFQHQLNF